MSAKHEEWKSRMEEEVDATIWEVSETSSIDWVRLLPWCISTNTNPGALPTCYMTEERLPPCNKEQRPLWLPPLQCLGAYRPLSL